MKVRFKKLNSDIDYLTPNKLYDVLDIDYEKPVSFTIISDIGSVAYCMLKGCAHIESDWEIVEQTLV